MNSSYLGKGEASMTYKVTTQSKIFVLKTVLYPERNLTDLQATAIEWIHFYSELALRLKQEGIDLLARRILKIF